MVESVPTTAPIGRFSAIDVAVSCNSLGFSLTLVTVTATAFVATSVPSLACTVTL